MKKIILVITLLFILLNCFAIQIKEIYSNSQKVLVGLKLDTNNRKLIHSLDSLITINDTNPNKMSSLLIKIGKVLRQSGNVGPSMHLFNDAITYFNENPPKNDIENKSLVHLMLPYGAAHEEIGLPNLALEIYFEGIARSTDKKDPVFCHFYNNIGVVYYNINKIDKAEEYMHKADSVAKKINQPLDQFYALNNLAEIYLNKHRLDSALDIALQAIQLIDKKKDNYLYYGIQLTIANIYIELGDYDLAYSYLQNTEHNNKFYKHQTELIYTYECFANYYLKLNETSKALIKMNQAIKIAEKIKDNRIMARLLLKIAPIEAQKQNYKKAYEFTLNSKNINDSIVELNNYEALKNITKIYATEKSNLKFQKYIKDLNKTKDLLSHKILYISIILVVLVILIIGFIIYIHKQYKKSILNSKETDQLKSDIVNYKKTIENKNRELITHSLNEVKSTEYINSISKDLLTTLKNINPRDKENRNNLHNIKNKIHEFDKNNELLEFHYYYEQVHPNFYHNLNKKHENLTNKDKRLCAFLALNLGTREIANLTYREIRSVESARNRLRKKLEISSELSITDYLKSFR